MSANNNVEAFLFDWDNTLVDTWPTIHAALNIMMVEMGEEEWSLAKTKANVKRSMRDAFPDMFGDDWEQAAEIYQRAYRSMHLDNLSAIVGAEDTLKLLRTMPVKVAAVSNKRGPTLREEIAHIGWGDYFDAIVGAGDAAHDKPHPAPAELALQKMEQDKGKHIWFVGDTIVDLECSNATGCTTVLYGDVEIDGNRYLDHEFHHHVKNHDELVGLITAR